VTAQDDKHQRFLHGELDLNKAVRHALERIRQFSHFNAFVRVFAEEAIEQARMLQRRRDRGESLGPLAGYIVALKDNIAYRHHPLTCGSKILQQYQSPFHATAVQRILQADGIIIGQTNMDEFAMGSSSETSYFGAVKNPLNPDDVAGGSSGGSAVAVATGMADLALGSDTGGSVRQPAAFCGVVGVKPTYGRVSRYGLVAFASSLEQIGPMAQRVGEVAKLLQVIAGADSRDATCANQPVPDYSRWLNRDVKGLRIGVPKEYFHPRVEPAIRDGVERALQLLEHAGAELVSISLPFTRYAVATYYVIASAEASSNLARFDGVRYGFRAPASDPETMFRKTRSLGFGAEVKRRIMLGTYVLSAGYYRAYYQKARKVQRLIQQEYLRAFEGVDVLVTPTTPTFPFRLGEKLHQPLQMYLSDAFTVPANLAGICAMNLPLRESGLEFAVGLQLMAPPFREELLFQVGDFVEREWSQKESGTS